MIKYIDSTRSIFLSDGALHIQTWTNVLRIGIHVYVCIFGPLLQGVKKHKWTKLLSFSVHPNCM